MPRLSAIVVTHRAGELLARCLESLAVQERPPEELVVVVSGPPAEVNLSLLERRGVAASVRQLPTNPGYARACHVGAEATSGELLLLNDDTELDPGALSALEAAWEGPEAVYQPRIMLAQAPERLDNLGHGLFLDGSCWALGRNGEALPSSLPGAFSGAAVLIPRALWESTGGFDAAFGAWAEDLDLSLRLLRRGVPVLPVPKAVVRHHLGATYGRTGADKLRQLERNRLRAALRSLPRSLLLTLPFWTLSRYGLLGALALSGRGPGDGVPAEARLAAILGMLDGLRDAPHSLRSRRQDSASWKLGEGAMLRAIWERRARWEDLCRSAP